jgi:hypothetical protein
VSAAIVYYGSTPSDMSVLANIKAPVLGLYGGNDARITANVEPTAAKMKEFGKRFTYHIYEGAGHGFLRQQSGAEANLRAAEQAWPDARVFQGAFEMKTLTIAMVAAAASCCDTRGAGTGCRRDDRGRDAWGRAARQRSPISAVE